MERVEAIAEQMITDLTIAIAAEQVFSPAASDVQVMKFFQRGLAGPAFDFVRHMLLLSEVMALMRLWDDTDTVQSIPAFVSLMKDTDVVDKLAERERLLTEDTKRFDVATLGRAKRKLPFSAGRETAD
jgi:AbiU2